MVKQVLLGQNLSNIDEDSLKKKVNQLFQEQPLSSPRGGWDSDELIRYHTIMPSRFNWGPENVHLEKTYFMDLNIDARVLLFFGNIKIVWHKCLF